MRGLASARIGLAAGIMLAGLVCAAPAAAGTEGTVVVRATGIGQARAVCPPGTGVYGTGGASASGVVRSIAPDPDLTSVTVIGGGAIDRVTAAAICGRPTTFARLVTVTGPGAARAECPDGTSLFGAGGTVRGAGYLTGIEPDSALNSVRVTGRDIGVLVEAGAICRSASAITLVVETSKYDSDAPKKVTAACPSGLSLFGGAGSIKDGGGVIALATLVDPGADSVTASGKAVEPGLARWSVTAYATCG